MTASATVVPNGQHPHPQPSSSSTVVPTPQSPPINQPPPNDQPEIPPTCTPNNNPQANGADPHPQSSPSNPTSQRQANNNQPLNDQPETPQIETKPKERRKSSVARFLAVVKETDNWKLSMILFFIGIYLLFGGICGALTSASATSAQFTTISFTLLYCMIFSVGFVASYAGLRALTILSIGRVNLDGSIPETYGPFKTKTKVGVFLLVSFLAQVPMIINDPIQYQTSRSYECGIEAYEKAALEKKEPNYLYAAISFVAMISAMLVYYFWCKFFDSNGFNQNNSTAMKVVTYYNYFAIS